MTSEASEPKPVFSAEHVGIEPNTYLSTPRWARILLYDTIATTTWTTYYDKDPSGIREATHEYDSFTSWIHRNITGLTGRTDRIREAYIGGFPVIHSLQDDNDYECVHLWPNNTDIESDAQAFPVHAIEAVLLTSKRESQLRIHADNLAADGEISTKYRVPVLLQVDSGKTEAVLSRPATTDDMLRAVDELQDPLFYFGPSVPPERLKVDPSVKMPDKPFMGIGSTRREHSRIDHLTASGRARVLQINVE